MVPYGGYIEEISKDWLSNSGKEQNMKCNIGRTDKIIRLIVGLTIIGIGFYFKTWWGAIGLLPLMTVVTGFCGLYKILGISTVCKTEAKPQQ
jgi:hypothetical protein